MNGYVICVSFLGGSCPTGGASCTFTNTAGRASLGWFRRSGLWVSSLPRARFDLKVAESRAESCPFVHSSLARTRENLLEPVLDVVPDPVRVPPLHRIHFHAAHLHGEVQMIAAGQTG